MAVPNYRYILIRLIEKMHRNQQYYLAMALTQEAKSNRRDIPPEDSAAAKTKADALIRNAADLGFMYDRATQRLTPEDRKEILTFNKRDHYDRSHPMPQPARPEGLRSTLPGGTSADPFGVTANPA